MQQDISELTTAKAYALQQVAAGLLAKWVAPALRAAHDSVDPRFLQFVEQHSDTETSSGFGLTPAQVGLLLEPVGQILTTSQAVPTYISRPLAKTFPQPGPRGVRAVWLLLHRRDIPSPLLSLTMEFWLCAARLAPGLPSAQLLVGCCFACQDENCVRTQLDGTIARWLLSGAGCKGEHRRPGLLHFNLHSPFPFLPSPATNAPGPGKPLPVSELIASGLLSMSSPTTR